MKAEQNNFEHLGNLAGQVEMIHTVWYAQADTLEFGDSSITRSFDALVSRTPLDQKLLANCAPYLDFTFANVLSSNYPYHIPPSLRSRNSYATTNHDRFSFAVEFQSHP